MLSLLQGRLVVILAPGDAAFSVGVDGSAAPFLASAVATFSCRASKSGNVACPRMTVPDHHPDTAFSRLIVCQAGRFADDQGGVSNRDEGGKSKTMAPKNGKRSCPPPFQAGYLLYSPRYQAFDEKEFDPPLVGLMLRLGGSGRHPGG